MANMKIADKTEKTTAAESFIKLARTFDNAMLVTHTGGTLHARPMSIAKLEDDGTLYFITRMETAKVDELARDPRATVIMQGSNKYLRVAGEGSVHRDKAKVEELWNESLRIWFEDKNDPSIVVLKIDAHEGEYWDVSGKEGIKFALAAAKAFLTGEKLKGHDDVENHGKVRL